MRSWVSAPLYISHWLPIAPTPLLAGRTTYVNRAYSQQPQSHQKRQIFSHPSTPANRPPATMLGMTPYSNWPGD